VQYRAESNSINEKSSLINMYEKRSSTSKKYITVLYCTVYVYIASGMDQNKEWIRNQTDRFVDLHPEWRRGSGSGLMWQKLSEEKNMFLWRLQASTED
jgi:hypothetical protein